MANKRNTTRRSGSILFGSDDAVIRAASNQPSGGNTDQPEGSAPGNSRATWLTGSITYLRNPAHWWVIGLIALLSLGAMGAGLKYLEDSAKQQKTTNGNSPQNAAANQSLLSNLNPFVEPPLPTATPQLSKEYVYAGSRLLAVEDANANAAPPADLAVWRSSGGNGYWFVLGGQGSAQTTVQWGAAGDKTVPGDYDGDGKTDFSVFRAGSGAWYIQRSSDQSFLAINFGGSGDVEAPADYDGDGKTDAAVFRPSDGNWYLQQSSAGFASQHYGDPSDKPVPADYDGDGKADLAMWRSSNGTFYIRRSSDGIFTSAQIGAAGGTAVPGDYDGDGKADFAVRNGADWIIRYSSTGQTVTIPWQSSGDVAVQNDYDGDGKMDIAVWRDATGYWYIRQSSLSGQLRQVQWGAPGDIPVPAFYRRG